MKKVLLILIIILSITGISYGQDTKTKKVPYEQAMSVKAGANFTFVNWHLVGGAIGPNAGISWERWKTPKRGFMVELIAGSSFGFPGSTTTSGPREIGTCINISVPFLWAFKKGEVFAFKIGLQPNLLILTPYGEQYTHDRIPLSTSVIPELNLPLCFSFYPTKRFSIDVRLTLPGIFIPMISPINVSVGVNASWKFLQKYYQ